jgi:predicted lactoylglutathione lyase
MTQQMFINLAISDVARTRAFFGALGYSFNEQFSNENALCMPINENAFVMMLQHEMFAGFIDKTIIDAKTNVEVLVSLGFDSAEAVKEFSEKAFALGARNYKEPMDMGFMYSWGFEDLDGHIWEAFWMNPNHVQG